VAGRRHVWSQTAPTLSDLPADDGPVAGDQVGVAEEPFGRRAGLVEDREAQHFVVEVSRSGVAIGRARAIQHCDGARADGNRRGAPGPAQSWEAGRCDFNWRPAGHSTRSGVVSHDLVVGCGGLTASLPCPLMSGATPMSTNHALERTDLPYPDRREGKVRDVYRLPIESGGEEPRILIVATDRLSAFDVVLPTLIPGKGRVLTSIATNWFRWIEEQGLCATHVRSTEADDLPGLSPEQREPLRGRVTIGRACRVVPIECVVRGYLAGSGWGEYRESGAVCGVKLPDGLTRGAKLPEPIFTPATKAEIGEHDENVDFDRACEIAGRETMEFLRDTSLAIFEAASVYALDHGIVLADTKFEFGAPLGPDGEPTGEGPILIDEALTPDSSRYWPAELVGRSGAEPPALDKQFVRDYLLGLIEAGKWDKTTPGPELPERVVEETVKRYEQARDTLFGGGPG